MRFKIWFEQAGSMPMPPQQGQDQGVQSDERKHKLKELWHQAFKALGVDGLDPKDALLRPLSGFSFSHSETGDGKNKFKGNKAVMKRLLNSQVPTALKELGPEFAANVTTAMNILGSDKKDDEGRIGAPTLTDLFKSLFGLENFQNLVGKDFPKDEDDAKPEVPPQPPKQQGTLTPDQNGTPQGSMDQNTPQPDMGGPPMGGGMGQQPQAPGGMQPPAPTNPMQPPAPAGAFMGLW
jgi:hypothetical protein